MKSKALLICLIAAIAVTGCAPTVRASNENTVIITNADSPGALNAADIECKKYGRTARLVEYDPNVGWLFDCLP